MQNVARILLVLHKDEAFRDRVHKVGYAHFRCWSVSTWDALSEALQEAPPAALVVVDPYLGVPQRREPSPRLRAILNDHPSTIILAAVTLSGECSRDYRLLVEWGVTEII
ncbi:MAG: hypothetical protein M3483_08075, partial [Gemmatimonadota bacterium]|nr:hypothetical protein [Gemmatimonadota bacterium]